jgi:uncharacterized protein YukE
MGDIDSFSLDAEELDAVIREIESTETALESITHDLESQMRTLHDEWTGLAASPC